jgi:putative transcriptional regulator
MTEHDDSIYLENQFLIAMPQMQDSFFSNTVTYLWKHSAEGALGLVINSPLEANINNIFEELNIVCNRDEEHFQQQRVLAGGPVEQDKGFILHDGDERWESSICVTPGISVCTSKAILEDIAAGRGPETYLIALGCAGWEAGQLEREIAANAWLTTPMTKELLFSQDFANKATAAAAQLGIELNQLSPAAGHS